MAKGIPFPEANLTLTAPTPEDAAAGTVYDLAVHRYRDLDGNLNVISKWQFSPGELAEIVASGGEFWFHCWGPRHPPIAIEARSPFVRARMDAPAEEHPTAQDYRNRAERAEAECAELREAALVWVTPKSLTDMPEKPGKASYKYVECLVLHRGQIKLRPWNCEHLVFDDEEQDDHFCEWHEVSMYAVLPTVSIENAAS